MFLTVVRQSRNVFSVPGGRRSQFVCWGTSRTCVTPGRCARTRAAAWPRRTAATSRRCRRPRATRTSPASSPSSSDRWWSTWSTGPTGGATAAPSPWLSSSTTCLARGGSRCDVTRHRVGSRDEPKKGTGHTHTHTHGAPNINPVFSSWRWCLKSWKAECVKTLKVRHRLLYRPLVVTCTMSPVVSMKTGNKNALWCGYFLQKQYSSAMTHSTVPLVTGMAAQNQMVRLCCVDIPGCQWCHKLAA